METVVAKTAVVEKPKVFKTVSGTATLKLNLGLNGLERLNSESKKEIVKYIGSSFKMINGAVTDDTNIPFSKEELEVFMPMIIGVDIQDRTNFNLEVQKYWKSYEVKVTAEPINLDITYTPTEVTLSSGKKIVIDMPDNIKHWFIYKHCLNSATVAKTKEERGDRQMWAILEDEKEIAEELQTTLNVKMLADKEYLLLAEDNSNNEKLEAFISLTKGQTTKILKNITDKKTFIYNIKDKDAEGFLAIVQDPDLIPKAKLNDMVEHKVLTYTSNIYSFQNKVLGTKEEALQYMKNPNNQDVVIMEELLLNATRKNK